MPFKNKKNKTLVIQTAKIGDYANSSVIFEPLKKFDIVLDEINLAFADYDERIEKKFLINDIKTKKISKIKFALNLAREGYENVFVLMPNSLNLFLARCTMAKNITTIKHYNVSSDFALLSLGMRKISHSLDNLTLKTYLKMLDINELNFEKQLQKPLFMPQQNLIKSDKFKIGLSLSAGNKMKTPPREIWRQILNIFYKFECEIYIFGVGDEAKLLTNLDTRNLKITSLIDKIALKELPFYISQMNLYISSDTGNYYIADSMRVPTICLMGPCFASEQRGVFDSLAISSNLPPISSVFKTIRNIDASAYFRLSNDDLTHIKDFTKRIYEAWQIANKTA
ncbi:glycosyltransferase family 9 protein [Campylobacter curvus]|uniref:glycosyltransferase family 9 protein n=1 Tax=Campylobacter curvus TaxID=200 RepID=UPI0020163128|nr:glycosyltransferase family 9 protein [Campylobacter curvus]